MEQAHLVPALWIGNARWLDFVNTRYLERGRPRDVLGSFDGLVGWLAEAGVLSADAVHAYVARWAGTAEAARVLDEALALRDALRELAEALARGAEVGAGQAEAVAAINCVLRARVGYAELVPVDAAPPEVPRWARAMRAVDDAPLRVLAPVADSAADLLCGAGDPALVRRCGNPKCVLYFYDTTKNRHRRFCSPAGCGNRVKAAARYQRLRDAGRGSAGGADGPERPS